MKNVLNILVISFYFPPYKRVGGRRWAKHCKYLIKMGVNTHVLTGEFLNSSSSWDSDILDYSENITRIKLKENDLPYFKKYLPDGLLNKFRWKLSLWSWNIKKKYLNGNFNDVSINTVEDFFIAAKNIIRSKTINTVILSVGPFRYSEVLVLLKKEFPNLKFVIDYRDKREDGCNLLTDTQKEFEKNEQQKVLNSVDLVITVNNDISEHILKINTSKKIFTLPHCVDNDFLALIPEVLNDQDAMKFIYGGELYNGMQSEIELFVRFRKIMESYSQKKCPAEFYLTYPAYKNILTSDPSILVESFLLKEEFQEKLLSSNFVLLFRPNWSLDAFSSKFFELLCLRKPVLYFGETGDVSRFLLDNKLGFHITANNCNDMANLIIQNIKCGDIPDKNYDLSKHSFDFCTKQLVDELSEFIN